MSYATASLQSRSPPPARARKEPGSHHDCPRFPKLTLWVGGRVRDLFWQKEHPPPRPSPFPGPRAGRPRARSREPPSAPRRAPPACTPPAPGRRGRGLLGSRPRDPQQCLAAWDWPTVAGSGCSAGSELARCRFGQGAETQAPGGPRACLTPTGGGLPPAGEGLAGSLIERKLRGSLVLGAGWLLPGGHPQVGPQPPPGARGSFGTPASDNCQLSWTRGGQRSRGQVECTSF
jgi:hypothetical protein